MRCEVRCGAVRCGAAERRGAGRGGAGEERDVCEKERHVRRRRAAPCGAVGAVLC